jgi:glycosyltransferase involved in cell wall biosynthesis
VLSFFSFMVSSFVNSLRVRDVDLVWGTTPPLFQGFTAWLVARMKRVPFLFEVRDLWPYFAIAVGVLRQPLLIRLSEGLERFLYRKADRIVVNSPGYIGHVQERGGRFVELVPNGVDVSMFDPSLDGAVYRRTWGLEGNFIALYAGAHGMSNDLGVLREAAGLLRDHPEISLVLLGDGKEKPGLIASAKALGLENILFVPPVPKEEIPHALAAADACIAILKPINAYKLTYPNKVFDYMAAGRPIVLAIDGVIRQVVEEAGAGIWVAPGDPQALANALLHLATARDMGRQMGQAGREHVGEHFNRPDLAHRMARTMEAMTHKVGKVR